jgi:hypothetical protein
VEWPHWVSPNPTNNSFLPPHQHTLVDSSASILFSTHSFLFLVGHSSLFISPFKKQILFLPLRKTTRTGFNTLHEPGVLVGYTVIHDDKRSLCSCVSNSFTSFTRLLFDESFCISLSFLDVFLCLFLVPKFGPKSGHSTAQRQ